MQGFEGEGFTKLGGGRGMEKVGVAEERFVRQV